MVRCTELSWPPECLWSVSRPLTLCYVEDSFSTCDSSTPEYAAHWLGSYHFWNTYESQLIFEHPTIWMSLTLDESTKFEGNELSARQCHTLCVWRKKSGLLVMVENLFERLITETRSPFFQCSWSSKKRRGPHDSLHFSAKTWMEKAIARHVYSLERCRKLPPDRETIVAAKRTQWLHHETDRLPCFTAGVNRAIRDVRLRQVYVNHGENYFELYE